jgi:hypothetical protein
MTMRLWTVQPAAVWDQLRRDGRVCVDPTRVNAKGWVHPQYAWLARQLRRRIRGSDGRLPWFAYCTNPDLRWVRHSRPFGSREVRIEIEPPEGSFVAFPCWAWHAVFTRAYLTHDAAEARDWHRRLTAAGLTGETDPLPRPFRAELEASWRRLFDPALPARSWRRADTFRGREAGLSELKFEWVKQITAFVETDRRFTEAIRWRATPRP